MKIEIPEEDSKYMYNFIGNIVDEIGPRMPGSEGEEKAAKIIKKELEEKCECDEVSIEPFKFHPRAFLGWIKIDVILIIISLTLFFLIPVFQTNPNFHIITIILSSISVGLNLIAFLFLWNEFFSYKEYIDRLFKEEESQNVIGKIKAKNELEKIIIFSGHHDSALQFNLLQYLNWGYVIIIFIGLGIVFLWIGVSIIHLILSIFGYYTIFNTLVFWFTIIGSPAMVGLFFFVSFGESANKVPGAVDNLSSVAIVLGLGRYLKKHLEIIPGNTEIRLISFGSEEAGLRGAYRYAARHLDELKKFNAEVVNMDGIMSINAIQILENEPTTRTRHSKEIVKKVLDAAELVEVPIKKFGAGLIERVGGIISGGTDAAAFSKAGVKATNIMAMEFKKFASFYHQTTDTLDKIEKGSLEVILSILIGYLINESKSN